MKPRKYITDELKIGDRPAHTATREEAGHLVGALIMGKGNNSAIVTLVERTSRLLVAYVLRPGPWQRASNANANGLFRQYFRKRERPKCLVRPSRKEIAYRTSWSLVGA
ncbi:hypothetical protein StoSoilB19_10020 [Arthrobacter sp. StoSoilB19]|nr:hypothetical protein StoSoilB19_10020 [Arthrobacter sp. StoSoilB19]